MEEKSDEGRKRVNFTDTDVQLLFACVKSKEQILQNKKTNGITPEMKRKAWEDILVSYNASQTSGVKTLKNLQDKYKNGKQLVKKQLSHDAREIKKTGGGTVHLSDIEDFGFSSKQIVGLTNEYDDDFVVKVMQLDNDKKLEIAKLKSGVEDNVYCNFIKSYKRN